MSLRTQCNFIMTRCCCCNSSPAYLINPQDDLVPVQHVDAMLRHDVPSARIMHNAAMAHADFLFSPSWQDNILSHVAEVCFMVVIPSIYLYQNVDFSSHLAGRTTS
jgi:hypothetical protein